MSDETRGRGADDGKLLYCSFCGKSQHEVRKLIAGPSVFVCDECVELCNDIIREELENRAEKARDKLPKPVEIKKVLDDRVDNILGVELPLWSKALGVAGRTDLVAEFDNKASIIDFKTSKRIKKAEWIENYFLQSTIYSMMFEKMYSIAIPQIAIIITVDDEPAAQLFVENRAKYVNRAIEILTS
jgi:hypothetical protein